MMTIEIDLSDATAQAAQAAGLLTSQTLERLLSEELNRRQAAGRLLQIAERVAKAGIAPLSMEEINAEIKTARKERGQRAAGH